MLPSQRALFDVPRHVCYLNAAGWSPLPLAVQEAGRHVVQERPHHLAVERGAEVSARHERHRESPLDALAKAAASAHRG